MSKDRLENVLNEAMVAMLEISMIETIKNTWDLSEGELVNKYAETITEFSTRADTASYFSQMFIVSALGEVLSAKYDHDEKILIDLLKDKDLGFIKEIKND